MKNELTSLDQFVKSKLNNFEVPYEPAHWEEIQPPLTWTTGAGNYFGTSLLAGTAVTGLLFAAMIYFTPGDRGQALPEESVATTHLAAPGNNVAATTEAQVSNPHEGAATITYPDHADGSAQDGTNDLLTFSSAATTNNTAKGKPNSEAATPAVIDSEKDLSKFAATAKMGCSGLTVSFKVEHPADGARYLWNFGDGYFSNDANPEHTFTKAGTFDVSLSVTNNSSGNIASSVIRDMIVVYGTPKADFTVEGHYGSPEFVFKDLSIDATSVEWDFGDNATSKEKTPRHTYKSPGEYTVVLTAVNEFGCRDSLVKTVKVAPGN